MGHELELTDPKPGVLVMNCLSGALYFFGIRDRGLSDSRFVFIRVHSWLKGSNGRSTKRRTGDSNDRHAWRHKSEWRHFRRVGDVANGLGQRDSRGENGASACGHGGDGGNVVSATGEGGGHRKMLCARGENRADFDDHTRRRLGPTL